jgi:hypothetical protein
MEEGEEVGRSKASFGYQEFQWQYETASSPTAGGRLSSASATFLYRVVQLIG